MAEEVERWGVIRNRENNIDKGAKAQEHRAFVTAEVVCVGQQGS